VERGLLPAGAGPVSGRPADAAEELLALVDRIASRLPHLPRLAILDAVEEEWLRLGANLEPYLRPLVGPAAVWRLRCGPDPV
jgi:hypothetical protein